MNKPSFIRLLKRIWKSNTADRCAGSGK